ncbi:hypothetical protein ACWJKU_11820 [Methylocaldum sp. MU1018]
MVGFVAHPEGKIGKGLIAGTDFEDEAERKISMQGEQPFGGWIRAPIGLFDSVGVYISY